MARKSDKLTDLPTACRFAVLEVSDDDEEDSKTTVSSSAPKGGAKTTDSTSNSAAKRKKNRRKKNRSRNNQGEALETVPDTCAETVTKENTVVEGEVKGEEEWKSWQHKDEQFVLEQFQRDLQAALRASNTDNINKANVAATSDSQAASKKKKKEKPVAMSLDEFVSGNVLTNDGNHDEANGNAVTEISLMDDFQDACEPEEKTQKSKPSRKKTRSKSEDEARKKEMGSKSEVKKIVTASNEDFIKAEMVHIQEELEKKDEAVVDLHKTVTQQRLLIDELQKELAQVKKRNKQLCYMLGQGEMKEKSELLMQIEELNEVREQVVQLHTELEQERSRSSSLKQELAKLQISSRGRHGSTS